MTNVTNAHYSFLSWYRTGLATKVSATAKDMRGELDVVLTASFNAREEPQPKRKVRLIGPGDIIGLDARAIVRTDPRPSRTISSPTTWQQWSSSMRTFSGATRPGRPTHNVCCPGWRWWC